MSVAEIPARAAGSPAPGDWVADGHLVRSLRGGCVVAECPGPEGEATARLVALRADGCPGHSRDSGCVSAPHGPWTAEGRLVYERSGFFVVAECDGPDGAAHAAWIAATR